MGKHLGMTLTRLVRIALLFGCHVSLILMIFFDGVGSLFTDETTTWKVGYLFHRAGLYNWTTPCEVSNIPTLMVAIAID